MDSYLSDTTIKRATSRHSIQTQWEDPALLHHGYAKQPANGKELIIKKWNTHVVHGILKIDSDSLLYTGIPLETFNTLVSTLEMFSGAFTIAVRDQVLLTLMKFEPCDR